MSEDQQLDLETHLVDGTDYNEGIAGWYCWDPELTYWPSDPSWNNCGNGPELQADNIHGPYKTELEALETVREMFREENERKEP